ncbi:MAG TPA: NAD-dependent succinate-semialdehyde dehydrogenase [Bryobacteraceae bacterium]
MSRPDIQTINPANGELLEEFSFQSASEVDDVLRRAEQVFHIWRGVRTEERASRLTSLAKTLRANKDKLARTMTLEMGKIIGEAEAEVEKCAREADWYAAQGPAMLADEQAPVEELESYVSFLPLGPLLAVMPWNFPFWQVTRFAVPALLAGNVVVLKHAPNVQRSALELERVFREAGFPEGVFQNLIIATEQIQGVIHDRRIAGVTLTGSVRAGTAVASEAGKALKKSVLELGGSDAFIVLEDADIDAAVQAGMKARFANAGQVCIAAKRFILTEPVADEFEHRFVAATAQLNVGDPLCRETQIGPLARQDLREALHKQVQSTIQAGAKLLTGGAARNGKGFFYKPTALGSVHTGMAASDEETFGPVAAFFRVRDADEALQLANRSEYGLSSNLWTEDLRRARELARRIEAGSVFINSTSASDPRIPIGGVKRSGYGRELSYFGLREFVNVQTVWIRNPRK